MSIETGQVLTLNMQVNNNGIILYSHPYLVLFVSKTYIEIAQMDSLKGKEYKAMRKSNKTIFCDNPTETVIDEDSYVQLDNLFRIEYFEELTKLRRQKDKLSKQKFDDVLSAYVQYQKNHLIDEDKQVYMFKNEIIAINNRLQ